MRSSFVSRIKKTLRFIGLVALCFLLFANAHEYLRHHFFNLIQAAWSLFIQKEGTTTPGFASNIAWPLISIAVAWYLIRKERGKGAAEVHFREEAKLAMRVIVIVAILIYGPMAIWCVVRAVYDDHHNMASRWQALGNGEENSGN